jgi:AcrR family transcriptional regulator
VSRPVKTGRRGTGRSARARATRRRIVDAAHELFTGNGYIATTLEQIAQHADVAVQTVYFHFGNKATVLKEVVDIAAVGDDEPVALLDRPDFQQLAAETDPVRLVASWVDIGRDIFTRTAPIMQVVRDAAGSDAEMAAQWRTNEEQRAVAFRLFAEQLADRDALRPGLTVDDATDVIVALHGPEVFLILAARGWSPQRWADWMVPVLVDALLATPVEAAAPTSGQP